MAERLKDQFKKDPAPILPILEALKDDPSEDVRRSVANNLNDIAKDHPDVAMDVDERWLREYPRRAPLLRHALRGLLKKGERRAVELFDLDVEAKLKVLGVAVTPRRVPLGGRATLKAEIESTGGSAQKLQLDYAISFARPGGRTSEKVFRLPDVELGPRESRSVSRKLCLLPLELHLFSGAGAPPMARLRLRD